MFVESVDVENGAERPRLSYYEGIAQTNSEECGIFTGKAEAATDGKTRRLKGWRDEGIPLKYNIPAGMKPLFQRILGQLV